MTPAFNARAAVECCCDERLRKGLSPYVVLLGLMVMHWPMGALAAASLFQAGEMPTRHAGEFFTLLVDRAQRAGDGATLEDLQRIIHSETPHFASILYHVAVVPRAALVEDTREMVAALREYADGKGEAVVEDAAEPAVAQLPPPKPTGALERWRKRPTHGDALNRAAAYDLQGIEALSAGLVETARMYFGRATRELRDVKPTDGASNRSPILRRARPSVPFRRAG